MLNEASFKSYINNLPTLTWVKNSDFQYIAASKRLIQLIGCVSEKNFYGLDDYDQPWVQHADVYREEDKQILSGKSIAFLHPAKLFSGDDIVIVSRKYPLYDQKNEIQGIIGNVTIASSPQLLRNMSELQNVDFEISLQNFYEEPDFTSTLSKRESVCLFYLVRGKSAQDIANILHISKRTVEKHIENIKDKLNCKKKSEVIEKAIECGLINLFPSIDL